MPGTVLGVSGKFYSDRQRLLKVLWDLLPRASIEHLLFVGAKGTLPLPLRGDVGTGQRPPNFGIPLVMTQGRLLSQGV